MFRKETEGYLRVSVAGSLKAAQEAGGSDFEGVVSRLLSGFFLVMNGAVRSCEFVIGDVLVTGSNSREYRVGAERCECPEFYFPPERICKHRFARRLYHLAISTEALLDSLETTLATLPHTRRKHPATPRITPRKASPLKPRVRLEPVPEPAPQLHAEPVRKSPETIPEPDELEQRWREWDSHVAAL